MCVYIYIYIYIYITHTYILVDSMFPARRLCSYTSTPPRAALATVEISFRSNRLDLLLQYSIA